MRALLAAALLVAACAARARPPVPPPGDAGYPGELVDLASVPGDFSWRQSIAARWGDWRGKFEAVLQKQGNRLLILGLTPMGTRAFVLEQAGRQTHATVYTDQALPFPPRYVFLDVDRAYFLGIEPVPTTDGWHTQERGDEAIRELWRGGRLAERHFQRRDRRPPGEIVIAYRGGYTPGGGPPPAQIVLDNGWFGYQLVIETLEATTLEGTTR